MLVSLYIKEKLYIGEASVASIVGIIFGRHAANLFDPMSWGNVDQITLECSRIVLVVQCFAVGVELPKSYMERHWKSVVLLLLPVMTWGWLMTSLFIWWMVEPLTWLESLACAACVTATDPVLASSVVGKGKFAKRVPKHLRDLLSAESGCNDGMAFPFIYLSLYLIDYRPHAGKVAFHWICFTILYECIFGAVYGFLVGYIARHAIKLAERRGIIDRESFLVFYFVLALFCAGSGSLLGMDDLLIGFSAGVGFSNDGWFTEKTEESHVSNVIDLLLNLAYFVYLGSIIPWDQYNAPASGLAPWRLVVISIFVIFFRRIPIMLILKPIIPDVKTWREALFAGHFGPIGVGAIFAAILTRAELETHGTTPLAVLPEPGSESYALIELIWPITTFLVISSILVHGSSIAVFTLGKRINTLTITMSYTEANENGPSWMNRLPRISSQSRSMSRGDSFDSLEKPEFPPNTLPPIGVRGNLLRRQNDDDSKNDSKNGSRSSSLRPSRRRKWDSGLGPGGPVSDSAIHPQRRSAPTALTPQESGSDTLNDKSAEVSPEPSQGPPIEDGDRRPSEVSEPERPERESAQVEAYEEGHELIVEDEEGNVLYEGDTHGKTEEDKAATIDAVRRRLEQETDGEHTKHKHEAHAKNEGEDVEKAVHDAARAVEEVAEHPGRGLRKQLANWKGWGKTKAYKEEGQDGENAGGLTPVKAHERKRGPAHAYQFGNTIIVEDEDGEVVKKYTIPSSDKPKRPGVAGEGPSEGGEGWRKKSTAKGAAEMRRGLQRMSTWKGHGRGGDEASKPEDSGAGTSSSDPSTGPQTESGPIEAAEDGAAKKTPARTEGRVSSDDPNADKSLRYTISSAERYGLSGRLKDTVTHSSGRRASAADFIRQIQELDPRARVATVNDSDAPDAMKQEVKREAAQEKSSTSAGRGGRARSGTLPSIPQAAQFEAPPTRRPGARRAETEAPAAREAQPVSRTDTVDSDGSGNSSNIPTHDVSSSLARYGAGSAAAQRRARLNAAPSDSMEDQPQRNEGEERETAAEKRRRLAALGTSKDQETSSDEDDESPRQVRPKDRVQFASGTKHPQGRMADESSSRSAAPMQGPSPRVSWGGETGRSQEQGGGTGKDREGGRRRGRFLR